MQTEKDVYEAANPPFNLCESPMSSPARIDVLGILVSCLGHAAVLGGLIAANSNSTKPSRPAAQRETAMMVDFIELSGDDESDRSTSHSASSPSKSPTGHDVRTPTAAAALDGSALRASARSAPSSGDQTASLPEDGGGTAFAAAELDEYQRLLYEIVARHSRYPGEAKQLRLAGITYLAFRLDRNGNVLESWIQRSSGSAMLDNAALAALERSRPLPPIPASLPARMDFVIEIDSSLQQIALRTTN
ncbi:energy transducer TonB [Sphingobium sp. CFD-2]|uniref:energy transducer TonB n=1 Tax=Sphingobium sp. CFD-2 TaxID=2878542 RepID=UPI00214AC9D2|nr:energy transducer TonB [Sphingobium sp. CFD-2]